MTNARREQLLRELLSDLTDLVCDDAMTDDEANQWLNAKADQWSEEVVR